MLLPLLLLRLLLLVAVAAGVVGAISFILEPRESPSACGGVSCFTGSNSLPSLQFVDDYNYAAGGTAYSTGGYKPTDATGPLIQPAVGDVSFQEKCDACHLRRTMFSVSLTSCCSGGRLFTAAKLANMPQPASHVAITAVAQVTSEGLQYFPLQRLSV
jgi:hypothetical protein